MFYVYVLWSLKSRRRYIGYTSKEVQIRLDQHNAGLTRSTRKHRPYKIIHIEEYDDKTSALKRERFLKSGQGRKWLDDNVPR